MQLLRFSALVYYEFLTAGTKRRLSLSERERAVIHHTKIKFFNVLVLKHASFLTMEHILRNIEFYDNLKCFNSQCYMNMFLRVLLKRKGFLSFSL